MIEYKIKEPDFFIMCVKSIASKINDTLLQFSKGIRSYGLGSSKICLYEMIIGEDMVDIISDGKIEVMISIFSLNNILKRFGSHPDELTIIYDKNSIIIKGKIGNRRKTFRLSVLDSEIPRDPIKNLDKLDLDSVFKMNITYLIDMINDAELYGDKFTLISEDDKIVILGDGNWGEASSEIYLEGIIGKEQCTYSTVFAKNILKNLSGHEAIISFAKNMPLRIYSKLSQNSYIKWYLAPRVEQEDI